MGALPLNFFSIRPENFIKWRDEHSQCLLMIRKKSALYCHADHIAPLDYGGRPVLSPNGMNRAESAAKELELCSGIGIVKFFREKKFLVTGATGFLAKVLVEKILRTVPDVDRIYLIIKAENKEAATERLKDEVIFHYICQSLFNLIY
ncbi:hypothetical protein ACSBR1_033474 [Camellia fascicularis]